jgi:tetratricopeptide (TPR) repeat protein
MDPDEKIMPMASAFAAFLQSDWAEARRLYEDALRQTANPSMRAIGKSYLALTLAQIGFRKPERSTFDLALREARESVRIFGQTNEPPDSLAVAYQAIGTTVAYMIAKEVIRRDEWPTLYPEAIEALTKATKLDPDNGEARRHLDNLSGVRRVAKMYGAKTGSGGGCFIATAAYGSPIAPEVLVFRQFRDDVLLPSKLGAACVRLYYLVSPPIATAVARHRVMCALIRRLLLAPVLRVLKH